MPLAYCARSQHISGGAVVDRHVAGCTTALAAAALATAVAASRRAAVEQPDLEQLHWLPVRAPVQFKLYTLMHAIHNKRCPAYLADVVQLVGMASTRTSLHSAESSNYSLPRLNTTVGERAFSYAGPAAWNQLYPRASASCELHIFQT